jgi:hypothetical protein
VGGNEREKLSEIANKIIVNEKKHLLLLLKGERVREEKESKVMNVKSFSLAHVLLPASTNSSTSTICANHKEEK